MYMSANIGKNIITADLDDWIYVSIRPSTNHTQHPSPHITPHHFLAYKQYIIIIDETQGIYKHNIYNTPYSWTKLTDISHDIPVDSVWTSFIDQSTGKIYIAIIQPWNDIDDDDEFELCDEDIASVAIYDIPNNAWSTNPDSWINSNDCLTFKGPLSIQYIPSPHNILHIIDTGIGSHSIYDDKTQSFEPIDDTLPFIKEWDTLIYVEAVHKLFVFGYNHNNIHCAELLGPNQTDFQWEELNIKLPRKYSNVLLVFSGIIMFWNNDCDAMDQSIWFLDVYRKKSMKSHDMLPDDVNIGTLIKSEDCYLHGIDEINKQHIKFNLYELLPPQLISFYIDIFDKLIAGFLKETPIPSDLINLLRSFLPPIL